MSLQKRARALRNKKRQELQARCPALRSSARSGPRQVLPLIPATPIPRGKRIVIGRDSNGHVCALPDESRFLHTHILGVPGSGKSSAITHQLRQDIYNNAAVVLLDPHGNDPSSVLNKTVRWLDSSGVGKRRVVHLFDPSSSRTCGFNPLFCPADTDPSVIAGNMVEAVERGWGDEDSQERPTMRRGLRALFTALAELGLTLLEAPLFLMFDDPYRARAWGLQKLKDERARAYFERLNRLSENPRMSQTFDVETVGVLNRLEEFTSSAAIRRVFGQRDGIDLRQAMDAGHVVLVNLAGSTSVYEKEGDLLGRLFLRSLLFNAKRRSNKRPCFVWMDEGHRFLSGDIPIMFEEIRKHAVGITIAHQDLSQLGKPGDRIREAILAVPQNRLLFRLNSMAEATLLAPEMVQLNLERPVSVLTKPSVVGHEIRRMRSESTGDGVTATNSQNHTVTTTQSESTGASVGGSKDTSRSKAHSRATTKGISRSVADGVADSVAVTHSNSTTHGTTDTQSESESCGGSSGSGGSHSDASSWSQDRGQGISTTNTTDPTSTDWPDRTQSSNLSNGRSGGESDAASWSEQDNWSESSGSSHSDTEMHTEGVAETESHAVSKVVTEGESESESSGTTISRGESHGLNWATTKQNGTSTGVGNTIGSSTGTSTTHSLGFTESLAPIMEDRASAVHSKENVIYMAAEVITRLPTGTAIVKALVGNRVVSAIVQLPLVSDIPEQISGTACLHLLERTPSARPSVEVDQLIAKRREWLKTKAVETLSGPEEPKTSRGFRVAAPKGKRLR